MKNKSLTVVILVFALCVISTINTLAYFPDIENEIFKQDILDLYELGIASGNEDGNFNPSDTVTRAEFCKILVKLNGFEPDSIKSAKQYFNDVSTSHWAFDVIGFVVSQGYISGYSDGNFYPDRLISYDEANKIIVNFLGYKYKAEISGGYPTGYRYMAKELNLSKGIELFFTDNINRGELCRLINNALDVPLVELVGTGAEETYEIKEDVTLLTKYLKCKRVKGFVEANEFYGLNEKLSAENCIMIDGINYFYKNSSDINYVGKKVTALVRLNEDKAYEEIINIKAEESKEIILYSNQNLKYEKNTVSYDLSNNKRDKIKIASNLKVIYNGVLKIFDENDINNLESGTVRLISKNNTNTYDIMIISSFNSILIGVKDDYKKRISDRDRNVTLDFSMDKTYNIVNSDNQQINYEDIAIDTVLTYYENDVYFEGYITELKKSGNISEIGEENNIPYVFINEDKISLTNEVKEIINSFGINSQVKLYLNCFDYAIYSERIAIKTDKIKYLFKLADVGSNEYDTKLTGKFYDIDNGIEIIEFEQTVSLNGNTIKNANVSKLDLSVPQMVQIRLNENNKIKNINTATSYANLMSSTGNDGFCEVFAFKERPFYIDSLSFDNKILFDKQKTQFMIVPENLTDLEDKDFKTVSFTSFTNGTRYNVAAYNNDKNYLIPDVIVCKMSASQASNVTLTRTDKLFVVSEKSQVINEDGEVLLKNSGYSGTSEDFFYISPEDNIIDDELNVEDLEKGDIIFYNKNSDGYIKSFKRFYNKDTGFIQKIDFADFDDPIVILNTEIKRMVEPYLFLFDDKGDNEYDYFMIKGIENVTIINQNEETGATIVKSGSLSDINIGDRAIVNISYNKIISIVLFK